LLAPVYGDNTAFSVCANIGKRSIAVNLKSDAGKDIVERMIPEADVFLEGFRPGVIERLGFTYDRLSEINPGLLYVSISGFGQDGPLREKPAMDPVLQAFTGFMAENKGQDGIPHRTPTIINDMSTALYTQQALAAALYARRDSGRGRKIEVSLMQASANLQTIRLMSGYLDGPYKPGMVPNGTYVTSDGWIQLVIIRDHEFQKLCAALGLEELGADPRFATNPSPHWRDVLTEAGLQNEVVQDYEQFIHHPHVEETGLISWLEQPGSEAPWPVPNIPGLPRLDPEVMETIAPRIGQHTREVLTDMGYAADDIDALAAAGDIGL
jgi:crotonobetainyl-CoA:carnitine CoA-transferase CaiB-like acyl-CoA transferase